MTANHDDDSDSAKESLRRHVLELESKIARVKDEVAEARFGLADLRGETRLRRRGDERQPSTHGSRLRTATKRLRSAERAVERVELAEVHLAALRSSLAEVRARRGRLETRLRAASARPGMCLVGHFFSLAETQFLLDHYVSLGVELEATRLVNDPRQLDPAELREEQSGEEHTGQETRFRAPRGRSGSAAARPRRAARTTAPYRVVPPGTQTCSFGVLTCNARWLESIPKRPCCCSCMDRAVLASKR